MSNKDFSFSHDDALANPSGLSRPSRLSFSEARMIAEEQIDAMYIPIPDRGLAGDLCAVMAEMMILRDDALILIGGEQIEAFVVKEVYSQLGHEHALKVIRDYKAQTKLIRNKRAYLRTSLYNAVFETEAAIVNEVAHDNAKI